MVARVDSLDEFLKIYELLKTFIWNPSLRVFKFGLALRCHASKVLNFADLYQFI